MSVITYTAKSYVRGSSHSADRKELLGGGKLGGIALLMVLMVIPGTLIGKRILKGIAERHFKTAFRAALTAAGLKVLIIDGLYTLASGS